MANFSLKRRTLGAVPPTKTVSETQTVTTSVNVPENKTPHRSYQSRTHISAPVPRVVSSDVMRKAPVETPKVILEEPKTVSSGGLTRRSLSISALKERARDRLPELLEIELVHEKEGMSFVRVNETQMKYEPVSRINVTGAVIPEAMALPTHQALMSLQEDIGTSIDAWVAGHLHWSEEELGQYLTSEQVDAVALGIRASLEKRGLIIADQTGFGKGRIQAALSRFAALCGKTVLFMTEKENLFSDFWRDICDINSQDIFTNPFILNAGSKILDTRAVGAPVLIKPLKKVEVDNAINTTSLPENSNLVFMTYSQLNRKGKKVTFFKAISDGAHVTSDESHNCVGQSTTSAHFDEGLSVSDSAAFSSATFARNVTNLSVYKNVFPWLSLINDIDEFSPALKRALAEESIRYATENGNIIRREHDLSGMELVIQSNPDKIAENQAYADKLSPILSEMGILSRSVSGILYSRNEENKAKIEMLEPSERRNEREVWVNANFGSRLSALMNQFLIALKVEDTIKDCVEALKSGLKPVVVIESTMESLMRELSKDPDGSQDDDAEHEDDSEENDVENMQTDKPVPTYKEALRLLTERLLIVSVRRKGEKTNKVINEPYLVRQQQNILRMIESFPDLSLSPIDDIRDGIEREGQSLYEAGLIEKPWVADEISARGMRVVQGHYESMPNIDRNIRVSHFVNGQTDALVLTKAASTGLSLHDAPYFKNHGQRIMFELSPPRNVLQRIQMWGRIWRRGQSSEPLFRVQSSGLAFETYLMAASNRKLRELSASVTGSAKASVDMDVSDPMDSVGNDVAYELLSENPHWVKKMAIGMNVPLEEAAQSLYFVGKLFRRLPLLSSQEVDTVMKSFYEGYADRMKNVSHLHKNQELEGQWTPVKRFVVQPGDKGNNPLTATDVTLTTWETQRYQEPLTSSHVREAMRNFIKQDDAFVTIATTLQEQREVILEKVTPRRYRSYKDALRDVENNAVKKKDMQLGRMTRFLKNTKPGALVSFTSEEGELITGLVVDARYDKDATDISLARSYLYKIAVPGEESFRHMSLASLMSEDNHTIRWERDMALYISKFDDVVAGTVTVSRDVLDGNMLGAICLSHRQHVGSKALFEDNFGQRRSGVVLPKTFGNKVRAFPVMITKPDIVQSLVDTGERLLTHPNCDRDGVQIIKFKDVYQVSVPYGKKQAKPYEDDKVKTITRYDFQERVGPYVDGRSVLITEDKLEELLHYYMMKKGIVFYAPAHCRNHVCKLLCDEDIFVKKQEENVSERMCVKP